MSICPCGTTKEYELCCGRFIENNQIPSTPEELMRSRYTAYTQANIDYIIRTMTAPANHHFNPDEAKSWAKAILWQKLEVKNSSMKGKKGFVEYIAYFLDQGKLGQLHELSEFKLVNNEWRYTDGKMITEKLPQRNEPCFCGSGKKYKKCCLNL